MNGLRERLVPWVRRHGGEWGDGLALLLVLMGLPPLLHEVSYPALAVAIAFVLVLLVPRAKPAPGAGPLRQAIQAVPAQVEVVGAVIILNHFAFDRPWLEVRWGAVWIVLCLGLRTLALPGVRIVTRLSGRTARWLRLLPEGKIWPARAFIAVRNWLGRGAAAVLATAVILAGCAWMGVQLNPVLRTFRSALALAPWLWLIIGLIPAGAVHEKGFNRRLVQWGIRATLWILAVLITGVVVRPSEGGELRPLLAWLVLGGSVLAGAAWMNRSRLVGTAENLRLLVVIAFAFWLAHPLAFPDPLGTDSQWYALTLSDVLAQVHAGVFPVFVGQSEFQFNGSIFPIRLAPLFHHLGMLVDLISLRTLTPAAVQNALLILLTVAAGQTAYATLVGLLPNRRWAAAALAMLYLGCPGVLAVLYGNDLYMTWTTVPLLPLVLAAHLRTYREPEGPALRALAFWLGLLWWGHSPIALWMTSLIGLAQAVRIVRGRQTPGLPTSLGLAAILFSLIVLYPMISVLVVVPDAGTSNLAYSVAEPRVQAEILRQTFPAILLPVSATGRLLSDYQLGWSLWLMAAWAWTFGLGRRFFWALGLPWLLLVALLLPWPGVHALWAMVPGVLRNPTGNWVATRLYLLAAGFLVWFVAATVASGYRRRAALAIGLVLAVAWTAFEDRRFVYGFPFTDERAGRGIRTLASENRTMTRYSYLVFAAQPVYFSHGVVDPALEQRIFSPDGSRLLAGNLEALAAPVLPGNAKVLAEGALAAVSRTGPVWDFKLHPQLRPGERYALDFAFEHPNATGVLKVEGRTMLRLYALPIYGEAASFGSAPGASPVMALSADADTPQDLSLAFIPSGDSIKDDFRQFGRFRWIRYTLDDLPVFVRSWIPYRADLKSPGEGWLETPRMFQPGYVATVQGHPALVRRSPRGLVMAAVPAGPSQVVLEYRPPFALAGSYWLSISAILAGGVWLAVAARPRTES